MSLHTLPDAERTKRLTTAELRDRFLVQDLFQDGQVTFRFVDLDHLVGVLGIRSFAPRHQKMTHV